MGNRKLKGISPKKQEMAQRRLKILQLLVDGLTPKEMTKELNVSANVIFPYIRDIRKEYGSTQRAAIIHYLLGDIEIQAKN